MFKRITSIMILCSLLLTACTADNPSQSAPESVGGESNDISIETSLEESDENSSMEEKTRILDGSKLVVFGDSLTALGSWGEALADELNMYYFNGAMGGITTEVGLGRFPAFVANREPDFVTLCFGMNDLIMTAADTPRVSVSQFKKNMHKLIEMTRAAGAVPIVVTTNPLVNEVFYAAQGADPAWYKNIGSPLEWLDTYNEAAREVAAEADCLLADVRKACDAYKPAEVDLPDGIHLNELGNKIFTDVISDCLEAAYERDSSIPPVDRNNFIRAQNKSSVVSFEPSDWYFPEKGTMSIKNRDGALRLMNTNGLWPDCQYVPSQSLTADPASEYLHVKMSTKGVNASVVLYFGSATPSAYTDGKYVVINKLFGVNTDSYTGDILANQSWDVKIPLKDITPTAECYTEDGLLIISGIKIYVAGTAFEAVTVDAFEIVTE